MPPPRTTLDPKGYYAQLDLDQNASPASVTAAYRAKARLLHPDVPDTGNAEAFVALKQAYDVLASARLREAYDLSAQAVTHPSLHTDIMAAPDFRTPSDGMAQTLNLSRFAVMVLAGLGAFLCIGVYEVTSHLMWQPTLVTAGIRPNAATVEPLSPTAHHEVLYGPAPVRLAGEANFYVVPAASATTLWRHDTDRNMMVPLGQLPPFSSVQAVRLIRENGMIEVRITDRANGYVSADHLQPGDAGAARAAYCGYNAGPKPGDGELLERRGTGTGTLWVDNRALQPAVVKLRNRTGAVIVSVFLAPGGHSEVTGLPDGLYRPEYAIGELWSRACNAFAAGMRARRMDAEFSLPGIAHLTVTPDGTETAGSDISDQAFQQD
jgi:hypothetical protein